MLKKTIKYTDFNDVERTEDFYFNLSKAELTEMQLSENGGLAELIKSIVNTGDSAAIMDIFKKIILKAYGVKSVDGKRFMKVNENGHSLATEFEQTEAYSVLFMELASDAGAAANFIKGILPKGIDIKDEDMKSIKEELHLDTEEK